MENNVFESLSKILGSANINDVSSESTGNALKDGYYLSEVTKAELTTSKTSGNPMVALTLKTAEDGYGVSANEDDANLVPLKGTKNRLIWVYYVIKDDTSLKRFVCDMLKFEGEEPGKPLLDKEYFTTPEVLEDALGLLEGKRIYVSVSTTERDGQSNTFNNLVSWKRADRLGLPE